MNNCFKKRGNRMKKVITYGTYDLLHHGHIRLLERAKALGDYLIVGVTSDDFDKIRGKINVQQSLMERLEAVRATGIADEVIVEEYEGQKIDDIRRMGVDIFTVGSDWVGKFDYLNEYCEVVYLPRTEGVSSTDIRGDKHKLNLGIICERVIPKKIITECSFVNGVDVSIICMEQVNSDSISIDGHDIELTSEINVLLDKVDAVFISVHPTKHNALISMAIKKRKHVLCESPITLDDNESKKLFKSAKNNNCILMDGIKTAYSTAYNRILLMAKDGRIGEIVSIDAVCTSLSDENYGNELKQMNNWNSVFTWGPIALLPVFQILGTNYVEKRIITKYKDKEKKYDAYTKIDLLYNKATASVRVAKGAKSEGSLVITGTKGYIYVPAPWWKTDYFEVRYENPDNIKKYFYQLDGEGIRYEIVAFARAISTNNKDFYIDKKTSVAISKVMSDYHNKIDVIEI